jgi:peptide/nickel transport system substrate-binding protein
VTCASLVLLVAACGDDDDDDDGGSDNGDFVTNDATFDDETPLVIARGMDVNSLDPARAYCDTCQIYLTAVYETVIGLDTADNQTLVPRLASEWSSSDDLTEYTFTLDPDAVFADGSAVEAKDVKWSWERLGNVKGSASYFVSNVETIDAPDVGTVVVHLKSADAAFLAVVTAPYMVITNSDVAIENGANADSDADATDTAEEWFLSNSAGSGAYVLESYQDGAELRLTRNENHWRQPPNVKHIIVKETVEAVAQRQLLETGEADLAMQISADLAEGIGGGVVVDEVSTFNFVYIALWPGTELNTDVDLNDQVREAIRLAIDYDGMIDVTVGGAGRKQPSPIPNGFLGTENLADPVRDLDRARELLDEGGYPDGFTLDVIFPTFNVYGVDFSTMFQKLKIDLAEVGIELELQPSDASVWAEAAFSGGVPLTAIYFAPDHTDPIQYVQYFGMVPGSFWSGLIGVENQTEIDLMQQALETSDVEARAALFEQLAEEMIAENYIIPMVNPNLLLAYSETLHNVHYSACCNIELGRLVRE